MKITEAARQLNRDPKTLKRWILMGTLKAVKIGRDWDIEQSEVNRLKGGN
jgi:excisionase family DNA binding protein